MSREPDTIKGLAIKSIQEADLWWQAFRDSVKRWHRMKIYQICSRRRLEMAVEIRARPMVLIGLQKEVDYAHDILIGIEGDVESMARSAVSCEMAHRIYIEQDEQRWMEDDDGQDWH